MAVLFAVILAVVAALLALWYWHHVHSFDYWTKRGVPHPEPGEFVRHSLSVTFKKERFASSYQKFYAQFRDNGFCGLFLGNEPMLLVNDPDLVKQVLTKDFSSFHDRGLPYDERSNPLEANLFHFTGDTWRNLRKKMSPTFTSGKLKLMFGLMKGASADLSATLRANLQAGDEVQFKDLLQRYAVDLIGTCAFGMQCNALKDNNDEIIRAAREALRITAAQSLRFLLTMHVHPALAKLVPVKQRAAKFFLDLMKDTVEHREKHKIERNDFVNLMMQLREENEDPESESKVEFSTAIMTAMAFLFFAAGLDSVVNTVGWALRELILNPALQEEAAGEVRAVVQEHGGEMTHESLKKMTLINGIINESLRKYTPASPLFRQANARIDLGGRLTVEKGVHVHIPVDCLHMDPEYYPEPERFDPGRWTGAEAETRHPFTFLPFGEGPRVCIAERFARLEMNMCLAALLSEFRFASGDNFDKDPKEDVDCFGPTPISGFWFKVAVR